MAQLRITTALLAEKVRQSGVSAEEVARLTGGSVVLAPSDTWRALLPYARAMVAFQSAIGEMLQADAAPPEPPPEPTP